MGTTGLFSLHCFQDLLSKHLKWQRWQNSTFKQNNVTLSKKILVEKEGSYEELVDELITELQTFSAHLFVARWQHRQFIILKDQRNEDTLLTVSDFAENHRLVNQDEIASACCCMKFRPLCKSAVSHKKMPSGTFTQTLLYNRCVKPAIVSRCYPCVKATFEQTTEFPTLIHFEQTTEFPTHIHFARSNYRKRSTLYIWSYV